MRARSKSLLTVFAAMLVLGFAGTASAGSDGNSAARAAFAQAEKHWRAGDVRAARVELMNAIKADPDWIEARLAQAEALLRLGDGVAAEAELRNALQLGAEPAGLRHMLGHAFFLQGALAQASEQLSAGDIPDQHRGYAAHILGRVAVAMGDREQAGAAFEYAMRRHPEDPELWVDVARFRAGNGDQAGATAAADEALRLAPTDVAALQYRGELMRDQFGLLASLPWFERALQVEPDNVDLLLEYGATLGEVGRNRDMLIAVRRAMELHPKHPRGFFLQAVLAARASRFKLAQNLLLKMDGRMDDVPAVLLVQGIVADGDGNYNLAIESFRRLLAMQPENQHARELLARSLYLAGDHREVVDLMKGPVNRAEADVYALWLTGRALEALGVRDEAIGLYNRASFHRGAADRAFQPDTPMEVLQAQAIRAPNDARRMIPYMRALYDSGQRGEAYAHAQRLQRANMGTVDAHLLAADAAMGVGNYGAAINALSDARNIRFTEGVMLRTVEAYRAMGDERAAGDVLSQFLTYNPSNVAALRLMAYGYLDNRNYPAARILLEKLRARLGNRDVLLLSALAQAQLGEGDVETAVETARLAYFLQPSSPVVTHILGLALLKSGDHRRDALDLLEKAVTVAPDNIAFRRSYDRARAMAGTVTPPLG